MRPLACTVLHASAICHESVSLDLARVVNASLNGLFAPNIRVPSLPGVSAAIRSPVEGAGLGADAGLHVIASVDAGGNDVAVWGEVLLPLDVPLVSGEPTKPGAPGAAVFVAPLAGGALFALSPHPAAMQQVDSATITNLAILLSRRTLREGTKTEGTESPVTAKVVVEKRFMALCSVGLSCGLDVLATKRGGAESLTRERTRELIRSSRLGSNLLTHPGRSNAENRTPGPIAPALAASD